jgi:hypothetical protein
MYRSAEYECLCTLIIVAIEVDKTNLVSSWINVASVSNADDM